MLITQLRDTFFAGKVKSPSPSITTPSVTPAPTIAATIAIATPTAAIATAPTTVIATVATTAMEGASAAMETTTTTMEAASAAMETTTTAVETTTTTVETTTTAMEAAPTSTVRTGKGKLSRQSKRHQNHTEEENSQYARPIHCVPPRLRAPTATTTQNLPLL